MSTDGLSGPGWEARAVPAEWTFILDSVGATRGLKQGGVRAGVQEPLRGSGHSLLNSGLQVPLSTGRGTLHFWTCYGTSLPR